MKFRRFIVALFVSVGLGLAGLMVASPAQAGTYDQRPSYGHSQHQHHKKSEKKCWTKKHWVKGHWSHKYHKWVPGHLVKITKCKWVPVKHRYHKVVQGHNYHGWQEINFHKHSDGKWCSDRHDD